MQASQVTAQRPQPDLIGWSLNGLLAVRFPRSRAASYAPSVAVAQTAEHYGESMIGGTLFHWAGFGRSRDQLARALSVVHGTHAIKGFELYAGGQLLAEWYRAEAVLRCCLQAAGCGDPRAHCQVVVESTSVLSIGDDCRALSWGMLSEGLRAQASDLLTDTPRPRHDLTIFPCRYLLKMNFNYQLGHPASAADQVQSAAVRYGCDWCPNFRPGEAQ